MNLNKLSDGLWETSFDLRLPGGIYFPTRMTVIEAAPGQLLLHSPIPIDDQLAAEIAELGEVRWIVAPNNFHHMYVEHAAQRFPGATVWGTKGAINKERGVEFSGALEDGAPRELPGSVVMFGLSGIPSLDEHVFWLPDASTLVCSDLVFNMRQPRNLRTQVVLWMAVAEGDGITQSRALRYMLVKDRPAFSESLTDLLARDFEQVIMSHGDIVTDRGAQRLAEISSWALPARLHRIAA